MSKNCLEIQNDFCPEMSTDNNVDKGLGFARTFAQLSNIYVGATKKDLLVNNRSSCFYSFSGYSFSNACYDCEDYRIGYDTESVFGTAGSVSSSLKNIGTPRRLFHIQGDVPDLQRASESLAFRRALIYLCFNPKKKSKEKESQIQIRCGFNNFYSRDKDYGQRGGWYRENYRCYLANGNDQNVENIPIVVDGIGSQISYNTKNLHCYFDVINGTSSSAQASNPQVTGLGQIESNGFLDLKNKNLFDLGFTYKTEDLFCPIICNVHCQKYISRNRRGPLFPSTTYLTSKNVDRNFEKTSILDSYSISGVTNPKDIQLSGALSCVPTEGNSNKNGRLLMWSLGCISLCKSLKCLPKILGKQISYGLNVSTPLYVQKSNIDNKTDGLPIVCEANVFFQLCKINIPLFFDLINMPDYNSNNNKTSGKAIVIGCRPYIAYDSPFSKAWRERIICPVEGSLE